MKLTNPIFRHGYNPITRMRDWDWNDIKNVKMDFGILLLRENETFTLDNENEKAILLMHGDVEVSYNESHYRVRRDSIFDENPAAWLLPRNTKVTIKAYAKPDGTDYGREGVPDDMAAELCIVQTIGSNDFEPRYFPPEECLTEQFGKGTLFETSTRDVRTIFDANNMPESNLVLGEVINHPGKWSSYPPHGHDQPEIYHYRFLPVKGFGFGMDGHDEVKVVRHGDSLLIIDGAPHSQTAAPGYAMYYIWAIRHLEGNPYGPKDPRKFDPAHVWVMNPENTRLIWQSKKG